MSEMNEFENVNKKEELLKEAEALVATEDLSSVLQSAQALQKKWKRCSGWESHYEEELNAKFEAIMDKIYAKKNEVFGSALDKKKALIAEAKAVASLGVGEATRKMNELMDSWKAAGRTTKDQDDALWEEFNAARQAFFDAKKVAVEKTKTVKEELVKAAEALANSTQWKEATDKMNELMDSWKAAGRADKKTDDELWEKFSAARKVFFDAKSNHFADLRATYSDRLAQKEALVEKAEALVKDADFSKATTDAVKALTAEWKKIGSCGKNNEDAVWGKFNAVVSGYFEQLKAANEQKHEDWVARMQDNLNYKKNQIERTKRYINRLMSDAKTSLKESAVAEAEELIAEQNEFIAKLEADIADIEAKLNK